MFLKSCPDFKSGTQGCKICNISVPSVCSVSAMQDREMTSLPETVCLKRSWSLWQNTHEMCDWLTCDVFERWSVNLSENAEDLIGCSLLEVLLFIKLVEKTS